VLTWWQAELEPELRPVEASQAPSWQELLWVPWPKQRVLPQPLVLQLRVLQPMAQEPSQKGWCLLL